MHKRYALPLELFLYQMTPFFEGQEISRLAQSTRSLKGLIKEWSPYSTLTTGMIERLIPRIFPEMDERSRDHLLKIFSTYSGECTCRIRVTEKDKNQKLYFTVITTFFDALATDPALKMRYQSRFAQFKFLNRLDLYAGLGQGAAHDPAILPDLFSGVKVRDVKLSGPLKINTLPRSWENTLQILYLQNLFDTTELEWHALRFPRLISLTIDSSVVTNVALEIIGCNCPSLATLNITFTPWSTSESVLLDDEGIKTYVTYATALTELRLTHSKGITDIGLNAILTLSSLTLLDLSHCDKIRGEHFEVPPCPRLVDLRLRGSQNFTGVMLSTQFPRLRSLDLEGNKISDVALSALQARTLTHLNLDGTLAGLKSIEMINTHSHLISLSLGSSQMKVEALKNLCLPSLEKLSLALNPELDLSREAGATSTTLAPLEILAKKCPNITHLRLSRFELIPEILYNLPHFSKLRQLDLTTCESISLLVINEVARQFSRLSIRYSRFVGKIEQLEYRREEEKAEKKRT